MESNEKDEGQGDRSWHSWWPLLVMIAILLPLAAALSWKNFLNLPYVLLKLTLGMYAAHRFHVIAFKDRRANHDLAASIAYAGTVIAMALSV